MQAPYVLEFSVVAEWQGWEKRMYLIFSTIHKADQKTCKDIAFLSLVDEKTKTCRRRTLLTQLGSDESLSPSPNSCCNVCGPLSVSTFKFLAPVKAARKPRREVTPQVLSLLRARSLRQRRYLLDSNMKYKALGGAVASSHFFNALKMYYTCDLCL